MLIEWAARQIPAIGAGANFGPARAVGVTTGTGKDARLLAAVVFHDYQPSYRTCQVSMAASSPKWCTRNNIRDVLSFPFIQYGCNKIWTATPHTSERVVKFNTAIGFVREATLKDHFGPGSHAIICRMNQKYFLNHYVRESDGQENKQSAAAG